MKEITVQNDMEILFDDSWVMKGVFIHTIILGRAGLASDTINPLGFGVPWNNLNVSSMKVSLMS